MSFKDYLKNLFKDPNENHIQELLPLQAEDLEKRKDSKQKESKESIFIL